MKKIVYSLLISSVATLFVGCDYHDPNDGKFSADPSAGYVVFAGGANGATVNGNIGCGDDTEIRVPLSLFAPVNSDGLDVNYTITDIVGTSAGNVDISANIPDGELEGELVINYSDDLASSLKFTITLSSTSKSSVGIGAPDSEGTQAITVQLNKENRDLFQGLYTITRAGTTYDSTIMSGDAANELIVTNLFGNDPAAQTKIFLNGDGTVSFPEPIDNYLTDDPNVGPLYVQGISGTYGDGCTGELSIVFRLRFGDNLVSQTGISTAVFTRQ